MIAWSTVHPGMLIKALGQNTQSDLFTKVEVQAPSLEHLCAAFQAQPGGSLQDGDGMQTLTSWLLLPVHAKLACLFMKGLPVGEGFMLGCQVLDLQ
jgi:hypothetical protein